MVASLSAEKAIAVLWFSSSLAEEVGKTDANNIKQYDDPGTTVLYFWLIEVQLQVPS